MVHKWTVLHSRSRSTVRLHENSSQDCILNVIALAGTAITIYGTVAPSPDNKTFVTTYALDGSTPVETMAPATASTIYDYAFYMSPQLQDGSHILVVTAVWVDVPHTFWFDYLKYVPSPGITSLSAGSSAALDMSTSSRPYKTAPIPPLETSLASTADKGVAPGETNIILPAVLVPLFLIFIILVCCIVFWRRCGARARSARGQHIKEVILDDDESSGTYFLVRHS